MTITICGSMHFVKEMIMWRTKLTEEGFDVYIPGGIEDSQGYKEAGTSEESTKRKIENDFIKSHYRYIKQSEAVLILNYEKNGIPNYVGGNSLMEMSLAFTKNRDIFLLNPVPEQAYSAEINAMQPIVINNDIKNIVNYFKSLPTVVLSSESPIKLKATSLALREYNLRYQVIGFKTKSKVSEQPSSIQETYDGAQNRLIDLKKQTKGSKPKLYLSIESGEAKLINNYNYFGHSVCVIDDGQKQVMTILTDIEFPKEMTDLVPDVYPDLGMLVQEKYGVKTKDPFAYITHGKLSREKLIFDIVVNTLALI